MVSILLLGLQSAMAQTFLDWGKTFGGNGYEVSNGIATDAEHNVYIAGDFWIKCDFDPSTDSLNLYSTGFGTDAVIQKLDSLGNLVWVRQISGPFHNEGTAIAVSKTGCVYTAGTFVDSADFNPDTAKHIEHANGGSDLFLLKLSPQGAFSWVTIMGGDGVEEVDAMVLDDTSNLYLCGSFTDTCNFSPKSGSTVIESKGLYDGFVQKLDSNGNHLWTFAFGSKGFDIASDIAVDKFGNSWVTGYFSDTLSISFKKLISNGKEDAFMLKLDPNGKLLFLKQFGGVGVDKGRTISLDKNHMPILSGTFEQQIELDLNSFSKQINSKGGKDVFLVALDALGNYRWGRSWGGKGVEQPSKLVVNSMNEIFCLGQFFDSLDFNPGIGINIGKSGLGVDAFISKFDGTGNFLAFQQYGGIGDVEIRGAAISSKDKILSTGIFIRALDIDPTKRIDFQQNNGAEDIFVQQLKLNCTSTIDTIYATNCYSYAAPSKTTVWTQSGIYIDTLYSTQNCDSILVVDLTIANSAVDTAKLNRCTSYTPVGSAKTFTQSGIYLDTVSSTAGCDSLVVFDLTVQQSSFYSYSTAVCGSFTTPSGSATVTADTSILDTISNTFGCDSILTIQVKINPSYLIVGSNSSCRSLLSPSKKHLWTSSGTYYDTLTTAAGCDSVLEIQVTIKSINKGLSMQGKKLRSKANGASYQWFKCINEYSPIPSAIGQEFVPTESGDYAVAIQKNGCRDTSECISFNSLGNSAKKAIDEHLYQVFPNPFNDYFQLSSSDKALVNIELLNSLGQRVLTKNAVAIDSEIELDLPSGIYYLKIQPSGNQNESQIFRLIKR